jgi:glycosyltransferase involved in cell wall biosynthesis
MKLAIDCRFIGKSGIGTYIENMVDELLLHHPEHEYLLITDRLYPQYETYKNATCLITNIQPFTLREMFFFPAKSINKCDAYFSPYINIPLSIRIPVYSTIHDVIFLDLPELSSIIGRWARRMFYYYAIRKSKKVFTVSEFSKERIRYHFPSCKHIEIIKNSISRDIRQFDISSIQKQNYFIYVGNIKAHKGLPILLKAFANAQNKGLTSKLILVGTAEKFRTSDKEFTNLLSTIENVEFTGWVDNNKLCTLIAGAKALVLPSTYEGFGIPPMEAMFLGTEAIVSAIPVLREIYKDFPVTFFRVNDSDDLTSKLLECDGMSQNNIAKEMIKERFNCKKEVEYFLNCLIHSV